MSNDIDIEELKQALKPFAEFANTLKPWTSGYSYLEQLEWPEHKAVLCRTYPCDDKSVNVRKLYASDFMKAEKALSDIMKVKK